MVGAIADGGHHTRGISSDAAGSRAPSTAVPQSLPVSLGAGAATWYGSSFLLGSSGLRGRFCGSKTKRDYVRIGPAGAVDSNDPRRITLVGRRCDNSFGGKRMSKPQRTTTNVELLIGTLGSKDGPTRQKARKQLVALGKPAVSSLTRLLQNSRLDHSRWEAAKALGAIGDSRAIPWLVKSLEDSDTDVAWVAAEALRKFKMDAWSPLLRSLIKSGSDSVLLRQGAHHVFRNQKEVGFNDLLSALRRALESTTEPNSARVAAYAIIEQMKTKP